MNDQARSSAPSLHEIGRRRFPSALLAVLLACSALSLAQTAQDFIRIYDAYLAAVKAGNYKQAEPYLSAEIRNQLPTPDAQKQYLEMVQPLVPIRYETEFANVAKNGQSADVSIIATLSVPEQMQKEEHLPPTQRAELILKFVKESGQWKMGPPDILGDPDQRARPKDLNMGTRADYADGASTEVGGVILRTEKQAAGTVFVLRLPEQEIAVFVPAAKVSPDFVAGSILVVHGAENKKDKLKVWAEDASPYKEQPSQ